MDAKILGNKIKTARKTAGLTQKQLSEKIHKSFSAIQKYELGLAMPPVDVLVDIAKALDIDVLTFTDETTDDESVNSTPRFTFKVRGNPTKLSFYEHDLLMAFRHLNKRGQRIAVQRVYELTENPNYQYGNLKSIEYLNRMYGMGKYPEYGLDDNSEDDLTDKKIPPENGQDDN